MELDPEGPDHTDRSGRSQRRVKTVAALLRDVGPNWRDGLVQLSNAQWDSIVSRNVRLEMRRWARRKGRPTNGVRWSKPLEARTLWFGESFFQAKVQRVFVDTPKDLTSNRAARDIPDLVDATHFRDAAYVDVLVTTDRRFREVAEAARTPLKIMTFETFANDILKTS